MSSHNNYKSNSDELAKQEKKRKSNDINSKTFVIKECYLKLRAKSGANKSNRKKDFE